MYSLLKIDLNALKNADHLIVCFGAIGMSERAKSRVYAIKRANKSEKTPFAEDQYHYIPAPVDWYLPFHHVCKIDRSELTGFSSMGLYWSQNCHATSVLGTLRVGDVIRFMFCPDYHSTDMMLSGDWHADVLRLDVQKAGKSAQRQQFELDHMSVRKDGPYSSRMCRMSADHNAKMKADAVARMERLTAVS